jgi:hypothetical protein
MLPSDWTKQRPSDQHQSYLYLLGSAQAIYLVLFDWLGLTHTSLCVYFVQKCFEHCGFSLTGNARGAPEAEP